MVTFGIVKFSRFKNKKLFAQEAHPITHDDGLRPIAIGHLRASSDLKIKPGINFI